MCIGPRLPPMGIPKGRSPFGRDVCSVAGSASTKTAFRPRRFVDQQSAEATTSRSALGRGMKRSRPLRNIVTWRRAHASAERRKRIVKNGGMIACGVVVVAFAVGNQIQAPYLETVLETVAVQSQQLYRSLASSPTQNASSQQGRDNPAPAISAGNQPRVALLIGNGAYRGIPALDNPSNDAVLIKRKLERVGFRTELVTDANKTEMEKAILDFGKRLAGAGRNAVGLFYYAGHGVQSGEGNYLIPLHDKEIITGKDLDIQAVRAQLILERMKKARNALNIVILDACRNNPFSDGTRAATRGLTRMDAPPDTLVAYSAGPGEVADDGEGEHSPFAAALATALDQPGLKVEEIFKSVRVKVLKDTENRQTPWEESSLTRDFYFRPQADELQGRPFTVVVDPAGARVRILNIQPPYRAGMKLPAGEYRVEASASGYETEVEVVSHGSSPTTHRMALRKAGPKPGQRFRDCPECPELVVVPSGLFMMGSPSHEEGRDEDEGPVHRVRIGESFAVGVYEVTVSEFGRFVDETGHSAGGSCYIRPETTSEGDEWQSSDGRDWRNPGFGQGGAHPVVCVSWDDVRAYVSWLSRRTGERYRLLSESEWEYVARARTGTARYWGEGESGQCGYANGADASTSFDWAIGCDDGHSHAAPVGSYGANAWGLHDVLGNVREWTGDCWNGSYGGAPGDGSAWESGDCSFRVVRSTSWVYAPSVIRSATRSAFKTGVRVIDIGFRVARTLDP